jgi:hypothetical protein
MQRLAQHLASAAVSLARRLAGGAGPAPCDEAIQPDAHSSVGTGPRGAAPICTDAYDRAPVDSLNESQLAAGRDLLLGAGRHRCGHHNSKP